MSKKAIVTSITQHEVKLLGPDDWDGYEKNRPGKNWELIEYVDFKTKEGKPLRVWTPNYTLKYWKFRDHSKLEIVGLS
ncbi:hypothetical protein RR21198_3983 [Rhodococcus rhodochrous ATCC 21198]|uniref:hypothetical protein n=1 Tax=Rhodococcus aetherivorans TaxID=191292 RepID=UPI0003E1EF19|nr:hypothetical protein [Rhodococcus aetherivorans]ETT25243.1 hypothetical protein RR21198_3983 [Rhodococcus rhodochrous ATCC 21198]MDV6295203.1 hypothetical protein [Rhodococcus aetherivorans]NGP28485.1 hypothetical protein [Rhodococcus aetherivorans]